MNTAYELANIHTKIFDKQELSQRLGYKYIVSFYEQILTSEYAISNILYEDGKIIAYAVLFTDYEQFTKEYIKNNALRIFIALISFKIRLSDIFHPEMANISDKRFHLGVLGVLPHIKNKLSTMVGIIKICERTALKKGCKSIWGSTLRHNLPVHGLLRVCRYKKVYIGKKVVLWEKRFDKKQEREEL